MRPKKRILIVDSDEVRSSVRSLLLRLNGYNVRVEHNSAMAIRSAKSHKALLIVSAWPVKNEFVAKVKELTPKTELLVLADGFNFCPYTSASHVLFGNFLPTYLIDQVKRLTTIQRRPAQGSHRAARRAA